MKRTHNEESMQTSLAGNRDSTGSQPRTAASDAVPDWLDLVVRHVKSTDYGVVQIVVHDARVVQVEWTQRSRFASSARERS